MHYRAPSLSILLVFLAYCVRNGLQLCLIFSIRLSLQTMIQNRLYINLMKAGAYYKKPG
jgi:hypothetical protein